MEDPLAKEIIAEIEVKTAKKLTILKKCDDKLHENPPPFKVFAKEQLEEMEKKKGKSVTYKVNCIDQIMQVFVHYKPSLFEKAEWTYNEDIDSVFDSETSFVRVRIETDTFVFEKLIDSEDKKDFYEELIKELHSVPLFGTALVASFREVYRKQIRKDLESWRITHNERAREMATDSKDVFKTTVDLGSYQYKISCTVLAKTGFPTDREAFWSSGFLQDFRIDLALRMGYKSRNCINSAAMQHYRFSGWEAVVQTVAEFLSGITDFPKVAAENLLETFRKRFLEEHGVVVDEEEEKPVNKDELLAKIHELHKKELEWKMLDRHYRQKLFNEIKNSSASEYHHSREIDNLKKSMQRLGKEIEELYEKICSDLS